jgi:hypothetical protein
MRTCRVVFAVYIIDHPLSIPVGKRVPNIASSESSFSAKSCLQSEVRRPMALRIGLGMEAREGADIGRLRNPKRTLLESSRVSRRDACTSSPGRHARTTAGRSTARATWDCLPHVL